MVVGNPTNAYDLMRQKSHAYDWNPETGMAECRLCHFEMHELWPLADVPWCPGFGFILKSVDVMEVMGKRSGKHRKEI